MVDACFGNILDDAAIRRARARSEREKNLVDESIYIGEMDGMAVIDWERTSQGKGYRVHLMISDENGRFSVQMLFPLTPNLISAVFLQGYKMTWQPPH